MKVSSFEENLAIGREGEMLTAKWLQEKGWGVIPCYDYSGANGEKAPKLQFLNDGLVIPDLDVCKGGIRAWVEVKSYRAPAMNRRHNRLVHGIKKRLYNHYLTVEKHTGTDVFIAIHERDSGDLLFQKLANLSPIIPCQCKGCSSGGSCHLKEMRDCVYWPRDSMKTVHNFN